MCRADYLVIDRQYLVYLNVIEKLKMAINKPQVNVLKFQLLNKTDVSILENMSFWNWK